MCPVKEVVNRMEKPTVIDLEEDEGIVVHAASRIFAAYLCGKGAEEVDEEKLLKKSVELAIRIAKEVDIRVSAGEEVRPELQNDPNYRPLG